MKGSDHPIYSTAALVTATIIAIALASLVFVVIVLPAEYAIDPTGIGGKLGLTQLASGAEASSLELAGADSIEGVRSDEVKITVPTKSGLEYKFHLEQYAELQYEWDSGENLLFFDLHGEPDGGEPGYFQSYGEATASNMKGTLTTPFAGSHGWYWRNRGDQDAVITLKTSGDYQVLGLN